MLLQKFRFQTLLFLMGAFLSLLASHHAGADTLTYNLEYTISGQSSGGTPFAVFNDNTGDPNTVRLTMYASDISGSKFISFWYFNFDPVLDSSLITFTPVDNSAASLVNTESGNDLFKANGDGWYDVSFDMSTKNSEDRFTAYETIVYDISYVSSIDISSFMHISSPGGGSGTWMSAAKVQGSGSGGSVGWSASSSALAAPAAPEPVSATLFLTGGAVLGFRRFRKALSR